MRIAHLHPAGPSEWKPAPHLSHFSPVTPARHAHLPSSSHCRLTEPGRDSGEREGERKKKGMKFHQEASESITGWTRSIYHYSFCRDNRIAGIEFLHSFQMLAQNNLARFWKTKEKRWEKRKLMESAPTYYQRNGLQEPLQNCCWGKAHGPASVCVLLTLLMVMQHMDTFEYIFNI